MKRQKRKSKKWIALLLAGAAFLTAGYALRNVDVFHTAAEFKRRRLDLLFPVFPVVLSGGFAGAAQ